MSEGARNELAKELAQAAARRGEEFMAAVRTNHIAQVSEMVFPGSTAAYLLEIFGLDLFRVNLRLDDPEEAGRLLPYDVQLEGEVALLELGVLVPLEVDGGGEGHWRRLFGSSLLLKWQAEWLVAEVLPFNSDGELNSQKQADKRILDINQGKEALPLQLKNLDEAEQLFLAQMQSQVGRFNLEELVNALRLWRDFKTLKGKIGGKLNNWAAGIEYLITFFDYQVVETAELARRYITTVGAILSRARELAQTLNATQFDDRYSIHADPVAHYRQIFGELGVRPEKDEQVRLARERAQVFDTVEVPPDDEDFFGPS